MSTKAAAAVPLFALAVSVVREPRVTVAFELDADVVQPATGAGVGVGGATVGVAVGPTGVAVAVGGTEVGVAVGAWVGALVGVLVGTDVFVGVGAGLPPLRGIGPAA